MRKYTAEQLTELVRGYQAAAILIAGAELDIFGKLQERSAGSEELARRIHAEPRAMAILLDALASMDLLAKDDDGIYRVPDGLAPILTATGAHSILGTIRHQGNCMRRWAQLARVALTGSPAREESVRGASGDTESFIRAMHEISSRIAPELVKSLGPLQFTHLLDIGGASGTWTISLLQLYPGAKATIFDLPSVIPMAEGILRSPGMAGRIHLVAGDFYTDDLPKGADLAWLSAIVHQNTREQNRALFIKCFEALLPGGQILIRDVVMDESRTSPAMGAFFAVNMLVGTAGGGTYTFSELKDDLASAGFVNVRLLRRGEIMDSIVAATKQS